MSLTEQEKRMLLGTPLSEPKIEDTAVKSPSASLPLTKNLAQKREELEIAKLEYEMKKLAKDEEKLNTAVQNGGFDIMALLKLQGDHFLQISGLQSENYATKLELERIKAVGGDGGNETLAYLEMLSPHIPKIIDALKSPNTQGGSPSATSKGSEKKGGSSPHSKEKKEEKKEMSELEEYKEKIRKGEITEEQAYENFKIKLPTYAKGTTKEMFHERFEAIKNEKRQNA